MSTYNIPEEWPETLKKRRDAIDDHYETLIDDLTKLQMLCQHYGIEKKDPDVRFFLLSWHLAKDLIPGFQNKRPPGAKKKPVEHWYRIYFPIKKKVLAGLSRRQAAKDVSETGEFHIGDMESAYKEALKQPTIKLIDEMLDDMPVKQAQLAIESAKNRIN